MRVAMWRSPAAACLVVAVILSAVAAAGAEYVKYKDPSKPIGERVDDLLSRMTLAEKIGQMSQIERANASSAVIQKYFVGSVLSGGGSVPSQKATAADWQQMVSQMQRAALKTRLGIPIIYGIDAVHGHNNVYNATIFPHNVGLGATRDPNIVKRVGQATAHEARATGIPYTFAPCVAVCRDPRWGRCYESYGEDTRLVQLMTSAVVPGLQGDPPGRHPKGTPFVAGHMNVAGCAKHFVGDGGTKRGINENNTVASFHDLMRIHMPPYDDAVIKGVASVMISYSSWNGVKMHANRFLVTEILKNKMKFRGFVITDWQAVDRISTPPHQHYYHSIQETIHAGIDMVMIPYDYPEFVTDLTVQVSNGSIKMERINDAVSRILRVKFAMGLFESPLPDPRIVGELGNKEHREVAREAVRKSLVLLKNGKPGKKPLLPLDKKARKILVAGSHAHNLGFQCGGRPPSRQGQSVKRLQRPARRSWRRSSRRWTRPR
uniref:Glycoside hydrolase family 3 N-terminal domain-containing protein n=1 Tax=Oryza brachyantha TaxID=4533 RepID=J3LSU5_ORYBR